MSYTRANVEAALVSRAKKKMELIGFAITTTGVNADLDDPLFSSLVKMGFTPAGAAVADVDVAALSTSQYTEYVDRAEVQLLENLLNNINFNDIQVGPRKLSLNQIAEQLQKAIDAKQKKLAAAYGDGVPALGKGIIKLSTQARTEDCVWP